MDFVKITRKRAKVAATRRRLPPLRPSNVRPISATAQPDPIESREQSIPDNTSDVRWEKVHAVKSAIASGHYDVEGRLMSLLDRFAQADLTMSVED